MHTKCLLFLPWLLLIFTRDAEITAAETDDTCPAGWRTTLIGGSTCYFFDANSMVTWNEAVKQCIQMGSVLTSITSHQELDTNLKLLALWHYRWGEPSFHIGITDAAHPGKMRNLDGLSFQGSPWLPQPANYSMGFPGESCGALILTNDSAVAHSSYYLTERSCNIKSGYICKNYIDCLNSPCDNSLGCKMMNGSKECVCALGYWFNPALQDCQDVDECAAEVCHNSLNCTNTEGSYICECRDGYQQDGTTQTCTDINECESEPCTSSSQCWNLEGSYECLCGTGYIYVNSNCLDVDECSIDEPCGTTGLTCRNTEGSYVCE